MKLRFDSIATALKIALTVFGLVARDKDKADKVRKAIEITDAVTDIVAKPKPKAKSKAKAKAPK